MAALLWVSWEVGAGVFGACFLGTTACVPQAHLRAQLLQENRNGNVKVKVLGVGSTGPGLGGDGRAEGLSGAQGTEGLGRRGWRLRFSDKLLGGPRCWR